MAITASPQKRAGLYTVLIVAAAFLLAGAGLVLLTWHASTVTAAAEETLSTSQAELTGLQDDVKQAEATSSSLKDRIAVVEERLAETEGFLQ